jgi:hemin uptake protein HemP
MNIPSSKPERQALSPHVSTAPATTAVAPAAMAVAGVDDAMVHSSALLKGLRTLEIAHNGSVYRLQATRQGKLILTK